MYETDSYHVMNNWLSFWYYMSGTNVGSMFVWLLFDTESPKLVFKQNFIETPSWKQVYVSLSSLMGNAEHFKVRLASFEITVGHQL